MSQSLPGFSLNRLLSIALFTVIASNAMSAQLGNSNCPVRTDQIAAKDFVRDHRGQKVYFCCRECMELFAQDPLPYLKNLPRQSPQVTEEGDGAVIGWVKGTSL